MIELLRSIYHEYRVFTMLHGHYPSIVILPHKYYALFRKKEVFGLEICLSATDDRIRAAWDGVTENGKPLCQNCGSDKIIIEDNHPFETTYIKRCRICGYKEYIFVGDVPESIIDREGLK